MLPSASTTAIYSRRRLLSALAVLSFLLLVCLAAYAQTAPPSDDDYPDQYDETARVARISFLEGEVSLKRDGRDVWEDAQINYPLIEGDVLATGRGARVELQIDGRNFVRVGNDSVLRVVTLRDEGVALSLSEGVATVNLTRFDKDREYFEVDAPRSTLAAEKTGNYRVDAARDGRVRFTVRGSGRARVYSESSGFTLRDDKTAELVFYAADDSDWNVANAASYDRWDDWTNERERYVTARYHYDDGYTDGRIWGAEDLYAYGDWTYVHDYGWLWRPHASALNGYSDWSPYRYGSWTWCPPYGWTWVGREPWGWAPYHYGRWHYYNNAWYWSPRGYGSNVTVYNRWRPALVNFVYLNNSYNNYVTWYPLGWNQRDPRGRYYRDNNRRLQALSANDIARLERTNPAYVRAVSGLPTRNFGNARPGEIRAAPTDLARRALGGEPLRGRLPVAPADIPDRSNGGALDNTRANDGNGETRGGRRERAETTNSAGANFNPQIQPRATGASRRTAGRPLDDELRRARIYNGRAPRASNGDNNSVPLNNGGIRPDSGARRADNDSGGTGVIRRPVAPSQRDNGRGESVERNNDNSDTRPAVRPRPVAPPAGNTGDNRPARIEPENTDRPIGAPARRREDRTNDDNGGNERPQPRPARRNEEQPRGNGNNGGDNNYQRPTRPTEQPRPTAPPQREERRSDPPPQREEQRRPNPPPVSTPPRREEQRRPDPPPQREERREERRPDPPRREEPARPPIKVQERKAEPQLQDNE